jgi:hypothetical protein
MNDSRRFALGLLVTAIVISFVGFGVYIDDPTPIQPTLVHTSAAAMPASERVADAARDTRLHGMLEQFVGALARADEAAMRAEFPKLTRREARVLKSIRERMGDGAELRVEATSIIGVSADVADLDFVILAKLPGEPDERRLPFHATVRRTNGDWLIDELN